MNKPVTILTGFLGSGKTTFLNHLLLENESTRYAIIENEFGEQSIDNQLVLCPEDTIIELNNGCLCCTLNDNLYDILNDLFDRRSEFDEIIIEATGVADPAGLAQPFIAHPLIKKHFPLMGIICLVDSELIEDQLAETEEAINQIAFSDILLLNKTDLVSEYYVSQMEQSLGEMNPLATILKGNKNQFPRINYHRDSEQLNRLFKEKASFKEISDASHSFPVKKPHTHHHHHHTAEVNSQSFVFTQPFNYELLHRYLLIYLTFQSQSLYRMKGLVWVEDDKNQYILQSVGKRLDLQENKQWKPTDEKQSIIVFIGKKLQRAGLEKMLNRCLSNSKRLERQQDI